MHRAITVIVVVTAAVVPCAASQQFGAETIFLDTRCQAAANGLAVTAPYALAAEADDARFDIVLEVATAPNEPFRRARSVSGDAGSGIPPGGDKSIRWEWPNDIGILDIARLRCRVAATPMTVLRIESPTAGAAVAVDGVARGMTPLDLTDVPPGTHRLRVGTNERDVTVVAGQTRAYVLDARPRRLWRRPPFWMAAGAVGTFSWYGVEAQNASRHFDEYLRATSTDAAIAARESTETARQRRDVAWWGGVGTLGLLGTYAVITALSGSIGLRAPEHGTRRRSVAYRLATRPDAVELTARVSF